MSCPGIPFEKALPFFAALHCTEDPNWEGSGSLRGQEIYIPLILCPWVRPAARCDRAVTDCNSHRRRVVPLSYELPVVRTIERPVFRTVPYCDSRVSACDSNAFRLSVFSRRASSQSSDVALPSTKKAIVLDLYFSSQPLSLQLPQCVLERIHSFESTFANATARSTSPKWTP